MPDVAVKEVKQRDESNDRRLGVLVIGGGIAGVQAALDLANSGIKAYIVERTPTIGGRMAQLDKTFPTNDCSMCILAPKLVETFNHKNIEFFTNSELKKVEGEKGNFRVEIIKHPRYVDEDKCVGCGICATKCPVKVPNEFDMSLSYRKAIYVPFPQAVPLKYTIDKHNCLFFKKGVCKICEKVCPAHAPNYEQKEESIELNVGAIIVATGFEQLEPTALREYGYGRYKNVITALEFERLMNALGPTRGKILRPSDEKIPKDIIMICCVGSRDEDEKKYCSSVCCTYLIKEAIIAKEHEPLIENISILYIDIRTFGKGFEDYRLRSKSEGIRFLRGRPSKILEDEYGDLIISVENTETGRVERIKVNLVVLASAIIPPRGAKELAEVLGIELEENGFFKAKNSTIESSRDGIYLCGCAQGPKDIPDSVAQASGAAVKASSHLTAHRAFGEEEIKELRISEEPRIGVFVCHCGVNIGGIVDVPEVAKYAISLPNVVYVEDNIYTCSQDTQERIKEMVGEHNLNRVVVAACTPRTHEPLFQNTIKEVGLNPYLFEMANIRDQCSWVHMHEKEKATEKAKELVRMAVAAAAHLEPLYKSKVSVEHSALVIGGGISGMNASLELAGQGYEVYLVEKEGELGGNLRKLHFLLDGKEPEKLLSEFRDKININKKIKVYTAAVLKSFEGRVGDFNVRIESNGEERELKVGTIIVATGGKEYKPSGYLYGKDERIVTQLELEEMLASGEFNAGSVVMIQCVGSRNEERSYCSRVCCLQAIKNALKIKESRGETDVTILYKDLRTYGFKEDYFKKAREKGVLFLRYTDDDKPDVSIEDGRLKVALNSMNITFNPELLVLSSGLIPQEDNDELSKMLKVPLTKDGFFLEAHMKLRPVDFANDGMFLCGLAHSPMLIDEALSQSSGAASRAGTILSRDYVNVGGIVASVDKEKCIGCLTCLRVCPYEVPVMNEEGVAVIDDARCQGCGVCAGECPAKAIELGHYKDVQILSKCDALLLG